MGRRGAWCRCFTQRSYYQQLPLLPLGADAVDELLRDLLGADRSLDRFAALVRERTGGNPFFVEEVVQSLVEGGVLVGERGTYRLDRPVDAITMPATVQSVLAARIDRLPEREKTLLQNAAVIGKAFSESILRRIVANADLGPSLRTLVSAEFLYEEALYPEAIFAFKHPLTQEVAYRSQLAERRRQIHAAVARAIEEAYPSKLDEHAALLAHHWEEAGEAFVAAIAHQRAAEWVGVRDRGETLRHWGQVRHLLATVPASAEALGVMARDAMLLHGLFCGMTDEDADALFAEGMALAEHLPEPAARIRLLMRLGSRGTLGGRPAEALAPIEEARRLAAATGDPFLVFSALFSGSTALLNLGRLEDAIAAFEDLETACAGDPEYGAAITGFSALGYILSVHAITLAYHGRPTDAVPLVQRADAIARERPDHEIVVVSHVAWLNVCEMLGDVAGALAHGRETMRGVEAGAEGLRQSALVALGRAHLMQRDWRASIDALMEAIGLTRRQRTGLTQEAMFLAYLADAHRGAGDLARALGTADEAVTVGRQRKTAVFEIIALLARARALLATENDAAAGERDLDDATALVEATAGRGFLPFIHVERARLAELRGETAARTRHLQEVHRLFTAMGASARAAETAVEAGT